MKTDSQLKCDIQAELEWEPSIDAAHVGVAVSNGIVTLTGHLDTFAEKFAIERVVSRVAGVQAVAVELDVRIAAGHVRNDTEIAASCESALQWNTLIPRDKVRLKVEKGWVTLVGEVEWNYQRRAAEHAVQPITGVRGLTNLVTLRPRSTPADVTARIREALKRRAEREGRDVQVSLAGSTVTLRGRVHTWAEREAVAGAALAAPGIVRVMNELVVEV